MNRKEEHVKLILDNISDIGILSVRECDILDSVLTLFAENKTKEIKQLEYLLNEETESLLETLYQIDVESYATREFELMSASDESDLVDALENMNYRFIEAVDEYDMVEYLEDRGYSVNGDKEDNLDIVTQSDLDDLISNFLSADFEKRKLMLNIK